MQRLAVPCFFIPIISMCVPMCGCVHVNAGVWRSQTAASAPLQLELNLPVWTVRTELKSSARALRILNH